MNRYLFIGSVDYSAKCLNELLRSNLNIVGIMCPYKHASKFNSDYFDLGVIAKKHGRGVHYFEQIKEDVKYIINCKPDIIFVLGLSQLLPKKILDIPRIGCMGSHPALLPYNRGRHPIIWALANGLTKSGITLFWLNEKIDSGDIWAQREFEISLTDTASTLYKKSTDLTIDILREKMPELEKGLVTRTPQDHSKASYLRKRVPRDGEIDWRMPSKRIYNLVRALSKPYVGAHCFLRGQIVKIWRTNIIEDANGFENLEPGKVIGINEGRLIVKTGDGLIELLEHDVRSLLKVGDYL